MNICRAMFDEVGKGNGSIFIVRNGHNSLKMRCSTHTKTFKDVIKIASRYFGYDEHVVFLQDKPVKGCIYL